jgi:hypothetical protein
MSLFMGSFKVEAKRRNKCAGHKRMDFSFKLFFGITNILKFRVRAIKTRSDNSTFLQKIVGLYKMMCNSRLKVMGGLPLTKRSIQ